MVIFRVYMYIFFLKFYLRGPFLTTNPPPHSYVLFMQIEKKNVPIINGWPLMKI